MHDFPQAKPGQEITPEIWNRARAFVRAGRLRQGKGIRLQETEDGIIISAIVSPPNWNHPFRVALEAKQFAIVSPGWVNGSIEPEIDGVRLSGTEKVPQPKLELPKTLKLDETGRGYIALEAEFSKKWQLAQGKLKVVQVAYFDSINGEDPPPNVGGKSGNGGVPILKGRISRWPLAMIRQRKGEHVDLFQIVHGDLQVRVEPRDDQSETGRAFWF